MRRVAFVETENMSNEGSGARWLVSAGAVLAAAAVALSAYAAHGVEGEAQTRLQTAAMFAFGHGIALAALARGSLRRLTCIALVAILCGTLLFSGALVLSEIVGVRARTAPFGGTLLIVAWLLYAIDGLRK